MKSLPAVVPCAAQTRPAYQQETKTRLGLYPEPRVALSRVVL
jgi:hypothetical protein